MDEYSSCFQNTIRQHRNFWHIKVSLSLSLDIQYRIQTRCSLFKVLCTFKQTARAHNLIFKPDLMERLKLLLQQQSLQPHCKNLEKKVDLMMVIDERITAVIKIHLLVSLNGPIWPIFFEIFETGAKWWTGWLTDSHYHCASQNIKCLKMWCKNEMYLHISIYYLILKQV